MATFTVGEEVLFDGQRYVVASKSSQAPYRYRLLATTERGTRFVWAEHQQLRKIDSYRTPLNDTADY